GCSDDTTTRLERDPDFTPSEPINAFEASLPPTALGLTALLQGWFAGTDRELINTIGERYLTERSMSQEDAVDQLRGLILKVDDFVQLESALEVWDLDLVTDFAMLQMVSVGGWQLSQTETLLCVLSAEMAASS
ncbi:MAG: hypothetical protein AAFS10_18375, partial [Myxococcota bacterium]